MPYIAAYPGTGASLKLVQLEKQHILNNVLNTETLFVETTLKPINSFVSRFSCKNNLKDLDPSRKTDLDILDIFGS